MPPHRGLFFSLLFINFFNMRFPLPFNSKVQLRFFEPVECLQPGRAIWDIVGIDIADGAVVDAISVGGASRFANKDHPAGKPVAEIKQVVDRSTPAPTPTPVSEPIAEIDDTSFSPEYQTAIDEPVDTTLPAVAVLGLM